MERHYQTSPGVVIASIAIGVIIGYFIGVAITDGTFNAVTDGTAVDRQQNNGAEASRTITGEVDSTLVEGNASEAAFTVQVGSLGAAEQASLRAFGVDGEEITITKGMVACAETEIGSSRVLEIQNGSDPSMTEGTALIACYQAN